MVNVFRPPRQRNQETRRDKQPQPRWHRSPDGFPDFDSCPRCLRFRRDGHRRDCDLRGVI